MVSFPLKAPVSQMFLLSLMSQIVLTNAIKVKDLNLNSNTSQILPTSKCYRYSLPTVCQ